VADFAVQADGIFYGLMQLGLEYLNHASLLTRVGDVALLCDPWLEGSCFSGGWGLRYDNLQAFDVAKKATHLWISHWHSDHLHGPSLERIATLNPDVIVLANVSANFTMVDRMRALGFRDVRALPERKPFTLAPGIDVVRYPTAGIDNMLHLRTPEWSILNYNDCNLTAQGVKAFRRMLGPIDLLQSNYNYAGKLFRHDSPEEEKARLAGNLRKLADLFEARHVIPFASAHYFRTEASSDHNELLLTFEDLESRLGSDRRFHILRVGDALTLERPGDTPRFERRSPPLQPAVEERHDYGSSVPWDELLSGADDRCAKVRRGFWLLSRLLPRLRIEVSDLGRVMVLDAARGASEVHDGSAHISAHSRALHGWLGRRFGDDTFFAGAHFALLDPDTSAIESWALVTLLEASHLDPRSALGYLRSADGLWFLWCRREELLASMAPGRLRAAQVRL
jgi:hypothetical protein